MNTEIQENVCLGPYNTFGMQARARYFVQARQREQIEDAVRLAREWSLPLLVLSGGSNMLITEDLDAVVLHMQTRGIRTIEQQGGDTLVRVAAGEIWHDFVRWAVEHRLAGVENLTFIPGRVGASPVQNIGAYGAEARDAIEWVEALDVQTLQPVVIWAQECRFGYRESVFKHEYRGRYVITDVVFRLHDPAGYAMKLDYGDIRATLRERGIVRPTLVEVADAIETIRRAKLPDPAQVGNSGSFFKNPVVCRADYERLSRAYPDIPSYTPECPTDEHYKKIPAAWMIDKAGWKGFRRGDAGVHPRQALVLVNYGSASGEEILALCREICAGVQRMFGVTIHPEVNLIDNGTIADLRP